MTKTKDMTASEFLFNKAIIFVNDRKKYYKLALLEYNEFGDAVSAYIYNRKEEKLLNDQYINKKELGAKIKQLKKSSKDCECCIEVLNEILKFIK